jgi:hypothetical protein
MRSVTPIAFVFLTLTACADGVDNGAGERADGPAARDSAGIRILEADPDRAPVWQVGATAEWSFSEVELESGEVHALAGVRSVARVEGDLLVIGELSSGGVLIGRPGGAWRFLATRGEGPDEIRQLGDLQVSDDGEIFVVDQSGPRVRRYDAAGAFEDQVHLAGLRVPRSIAVWAYAAGRHAGLALVGMPDGRTDGPQRFEGPLVMYGEGGADTLAWVPGPEVFASEQAIGPVMLGAYPSIAGTRAGLWVADGTLPELRFWRGPGDPHLIVRWTPLPRPEAEGLRGEVLEAMLAALPEDQREGGGAFLAQVPASDRVPIVGDLVGTPSGGVWVGPYRPPEFEWFGTPFAGGTWLAFSPDGALEARIELPAGLVPHVIGDDFVIGVRTDEMGVQSVGRYALIR